MGDLAALSNGTNEIKAKVKVDIESIITVKDGCRDFCLCFWSLYSFSETRETRATGARNGRVGLDTMWGVGKNCGV